MSVWDAYQNRVESRGVTRRDTSLNREKNLLQSKLPNSLSYHTVTIFDQSHGYNIESPEMRLHSIKKDVSIINSDNLNEKKIITMPGDDIALGDLVCWMDNHWLVTELDANKTIYTKAKMIQCNYLLKWVSDDDTICEQWCAVEDGTKYLTGEFEDRNFIVTRGDSRLAVTIAKNDLTVKFGRENRFLIDDQDSPTVLAYALTKPFKLGWTYNNEGVFKFVLQEVNTTDDDNQQLRIADFYKHFPRTTQERIEDNQSTDSDTICTVDDRKVWL